MRDCLQLKGLIRGGAINKNARKLFWKMSHALGLELEHPEGPVIITTYTKVTNYLLEK